uniref:Uncharacterized protein n=1 Tax=candidate division WOR-3 bacterium TaxID=2052148 RepID=A0A7C2PDW5_UNCW3
MIYFLLFLTLIFFGCSRKEKPSERLEKFSEKGLVGVDFNDYSTFSIMGQIERAETLQVENPHYKEVMDYVITEYYKGCVLKRYESPTFGKSVIFYLKVEDSGVKLNYVKLGDRVDKIKKVFGDPVFESDSLWVYKTEAGSEVNFYFRDGILKKVEWNLYID